MVPDRISSWWFCRNILERPRRKNGRKCSRADLLLGSFNNRNIGGCPEEKMVADHDGLELELELDWIGLELDWGGALAS